MCKVFFLSILLFPFPGICQTRDTLTYSIVSAGQIKGYDKHWQNPDGSFEEWFQFNDRGRGDSLRILFREDEQGFPVYIKGNGVDYMKNAVTEEFNFSNGKAWWKNTAEQVEKNINGKAYYVALKTGGGHLIKALRINNNKIQLIPFGEVEMRTITEHTITNGSQQKKLKLLQIKGLGFTPSYSWVDENWIDFANVNDWRSNILKGYESHINELLQVQKKYETDFFSILGKTLPQKMSEYVLIQNVNVFNAKEAKLVTSRDVLIYNGVIKNIAGANTIKQTNAHIIDGKGKTLVPALWDMHTHMSDDLDGILNIGAGITHVRDMGNNESSLLTRSTQMNEGTIIGPRMEIISGLIDAKDPMAAPTGTLISNVEEGKKAIRDFAAKGYQQIKLYSSIKPEWVKPLCDEAKKSGLRVCGHIPAYMTATEAVHAGYDEITHMNMLALNFFGDTIDTRIPLRFSVPAKYTASLDLQGKEVTAFIQLLKQKNVAVDPTLVVFEDLFTARDGVMPVKYKGLADHFPFTVQRNIKAGGGGIPVPDGMDNTYHQSFKAFQNITKLLYDNGITILPGTDGFAGFDLHRELELYVQAGIPTEKVLQIATWGPAVYVGKSNEYGNIAIGLKADFILVEGDPVKNISDLRNRKLVFANGNIYDPAKLYRAISVELF